VQEEIGQMKITHYYNVKWNMVLSENLTLLL